MVYLSYVWCVDIESVLAALSGFANLIAEAEMRCVIEEEPSLLPILLPNRAIYQELTQIGSHGVLQTRLVLQKKIWALLKKVDVSTHANVQAWENTYKKWDSLHSHLLTVAGAKKDKLTTEEATAASSIIIHPQGTGVTDVPRHVYDLLQVAKTDLS